MSKYTPFEPAYKITLDQCSKNELDHVVRAATAVIRGLNLKHVTFKEVKEIFTMPDHHAALRLGLTVTSEGIYHTHGLQGPHVWLLALCVKRNITLTIASFKYLRDSAKARRASFEVNSTNS